MLYLPYVITRLLVSFQLATAVMVLFSANQEPLGHVSPELAGAGVPCLWFQPITKKHLFARCAMDSMLKMPVVKVLPQRVCLPHSQEVAPLYMQHEHLSQRNIYSSSSHLFVEFQRKDTIDM